jgi:hypothetical protein
MSTIQSSAGSKEALLNEVSDRCGVIQVELWYAYLEALVRHNGDQFLGRGDHLSASLPP